MSPGRCPQPGAVSGEVRGGELPPNPWRGTSLGTRDRGWSPNVKRTRGGAWCWWDGAEPGWGRAGDPQGAAASLDLGRHSGDTGKYSSDIKTAAEGGHTGGPGQVTAMGGGISTSLGYLPGLSARGGTCATHPGGAGGPGGYLPSWGGPGGAGNTRMGGPTHEVMYPEGAGGTPHVVIYPGGEKIPHGGGIYLGCIYAEGQGGGYPPSCSPGGYLPKSLLAHRGGDTPP